MALFGKMMLQVLAGRLISAAVFQMNEKNGPNDNCAALWLVRVHVSWGMGLNNQQVFNMKSQLHPKFAKLLEKNERTADGVLFCSLEVILGHVREVTNSNGEREYRRWKMTKRLARMMAGQDAELARCGAKCRSGEPCRAHVVSGARITAAYRLGRAHKLGATPLQQATDAARL